MSKYNTSETRFFYAFRMFPINSYSYRIDFDGWIWEMR